MSQTAPFGDRETAAVPVAKSYTDSPINTEPALQAPSGPPSFIVQNLAGPLGAAVSGHTGDVLITNSGQNSIAVISPGDISPEGVSYRTWKDPAAKGTVALAVGPEGQVLVVNRDSDSVSVFAPDGSLLDTITHPQLKRPNCVAVSPITGDAFVTNTERFNLLRIPHERIVTGSGDLTVIEDGSIGDVTGIAVSPMTGDVFLSSDGKSQDGAGAGLARIPASRAGGGSGEITKDSDPDLFHRCGGVTVARNGDVFVTNMTDDKLAKWAVGTVTRVPAARAGGDRSFGNDLIQSAMLNDTAGGQTGIVASPMTGGVYVANKSNGTVVKIPHARAIGGSAALEVAGDGVALSEPRGLAVSPITGDLYITQPAGGSVSRLDIGIQAKGEPEGQYFKVPHIVTSVDLHTEGGSNGGGTGLDLRVSLAVTEGQEFYLVNQYNAAYIFFRATPQDPWDPLLVSGGAGTGTSVQTEGVWRSDHRAVIYPGNGGPDGGGGGGWGGGAGLGAYVDWNVGRAEPGSGHKGGDSLAEGGNGGIEGAAGASTGDAGEGGEGAVSLTMDPSTMTFSLAGGNTKPTSSARGGAGYCGGGNTTGPYGASGAGSGFAATTKLDGVPSAASPFNNNTPTASLIPNT
jgi:hypothetical protein